MPPELSGRELDRRVAELLGWKTRLTRTIPYHSDLNAVFRDVVPFAQGGGYPYLIVETSILPDGAWYARWGARKADYLPFYGYGDCPATAICRAFVALAEAEGWKPDAA